MGKAFIIPELNFSQAGMGKVTIVGEIPIEAISIIAPSSYVGESLQLEAKLFPLNTAQRELVWSVEEGGEYATINTSTGMLIIDPTVEDVDVTVKATSLDNAQVYAEKSIHIGYESFYTEYDYLVSNGQAQINTGYKPVSDEALALVVNISKCDAVSAYPTVAAAYTGESASTTRLLLATTANAVINNSYLQWCSGADFGGSAGSNTTIGSLLKNTEYAFWWCWKYGEVNGTSKPTTNKGTPSSMSQDFYLFGNGSELGQEYAALYEYKIAKFLVQNNTATETYREMVPCKLNVNIPAGSAWDNQIHLAGENGMWDKIEGKFYGNAMQSGTFSVENKE